MKSHLVAILVAGLVQIAATSTLAAEPTGRTLLFVDDHDVLYRAGTELVVNPAKRFSTEPRLGEEEPWEIAIGWTSIYRDPKSGKYQLWYQAYSGKAAKEKRLECVVAYAESDDGVHFVRPELVLYPYNDVAKTNIVLDGNGGYGDRYGNSVVVDLRDPDASRRYKMAYYDWSQIDGREWPGLHAAFSPDGVHWTKQPGPLTKTAYGGRGMQPPFVGEDPIVQTPGKNGTVRKQWLAPSSMSDALDVFYDPSRDCFVAYGKTWINGPDGALTWKHAMARAESRDFLTWSKPEIILTPDDLDPPHVEFHTTPVFFYNGVYFCLNQILDRRASGQMDVELATSRDGRDWRRPFRHTLFLPRAESGRFDSGAVISNNTPVILDDEIRFYYGGYSAGAVGGGAVIEGNQQSSGVGLATIPRDRFAGIRPVALSDQKTLKKPLEHIGQVTLKPLDFGEVKTLLVNADASQGSVHVEVLDDDGFRLQGFSRDDAIPLRGDSLRHKAMWKDGGLERLPPGRYLLRFHLDRATLYALTLQ